MFGFLALLWAVGRAVNYLPRGNENETRSLAVSGDAVSPFHGGTVPTTLFFGAFGFAREPECWTGSHTHRAVF